MKFESCDGKAIDRNTGLIDHGAQERAQIIKDAMQSAGIDRLIAQAAFERARAEQLEIALREAHLACVQHDTQRACDILMGALRF